MKIPLFQSMVISVAIVCLAVNAGAALDQKLTPNLYIILDASGSMYQVKCSGDQCKIVVAKKAIRTFFSKIPDYYNLGLYVFDEKGQYEVYPLGTINRQVFVKKLMAIKAGGKTPLRKIGKPDHQLVIICEHFL